MSKQNEEKHTCVECKYFQKNEPWCKELEYDACCTFITRTIGPACVNANETACDFFEKKENAKMEQMEGYYG